MDSIVGHKDIDGAFLFLSGLYSANKHNTRAVFFCVLDETKPLQILVISSSLIAALERAFWLLFQRLEIILNHSCQNHADYHQVYIAIS